MEKRMICFGVREFEIPYFVELGKEYGMDFSLVSELLSDANYHLAYGFESVMVRGNCHISYDKYGILKEKGLKYYFTRTVGYNHINLHAIRDFSLEASYVPGYSPYAISDLVIGLAYDLLRKITETTQRTNMGLFRITSRMNSSEMRKQVVGVIGLGRIGRTTAQLFVPLAQRVIAYDIKQKDCLGVTQLSLEEVCKTADILIIHASYVPGKNERLISRDLIASMKKEAIIINVARGELFDLQAALEAIENHQLGGIGLDVMEQEESFFFQDFVDVNSVPSTMYQKCRSLYPKVLITPHVGSCTNQALIDTITGVMENWKEYEKLGTCKNRLN